MFKFVLAVVLSGLTAQAAPAPEFLGTYAFNQTELKITQIQHLVTVAVRNDEAKNFVNSLKKQGYQCQQAPNSMSKCKKFDRGIIEDADLRADIVREFSKSTLNFELSNEDYKVINNAPALTELEKSQSSTFGTVLFNKIRLYVFPEGLIKLKIFSTSHDDESYFYLNSSSQISQQISAVKINQKLNLNIVDDRIVYLYEAVWTK